MKKLLIGLAIIVSTEANANADDWSRACDMAGYFASNALEQRYNGMSEQDLVEVNQSTMDSFASSQAASVLYSCA